MPVELITIVVAFVALGCISIYFYKDRERLIGKLKKTQAELRALIILEDTVILERPAVRPPHERYTSPLPPVSTTLEHRLIRQSSGRNDHYPFILPNFEPASRPNKMMEAPRIEKVTMSANNWIKSRDQFGFVMNEYSGLWENVGEAIRENFDGNWLVPKKKTGFHQIIRFKEVRPQDFAPGIHPRDLPEVPNPNLQHPPFELSPL